MATTRKDGALTKEKVNKSPASQSQDLRERRTKSPASSSEKNATAVTSPKKTTVPNYLKPTFSSCPTAKPQKRALKKSNSFTRSQPKTLLPSKPKPKDKNKVKKDKDKDKEQDMPPHSPNPQEEIKEEVKVSPEEPIPSIIPVESEEFSIVSPTQIEEKPAQEEEVAVVGQGEEEEEEEKEEEGEEEVGFAEEEERREREDVVENLKGFEDGGESKESRKEAVAVAAPSQQGKKEAAPVYNDVIEETASKLAEKKKSKVLALVGAFETVISLDSGSPGQ
ncbi:uncharacterized protein LOC144712670 [Wolffia australiana]